MLAISLLRLTLRSVLQDVPHDAAALVTYLLLGLFVFFVVVGGRGGAPPAEREHSSEKDAA